MLFLTTATGGNYQIVETSSILYLTSARDITYLFTGSGIVETTLPIHYFQKALSSRQFCRIHDAYIVAIDRIISFDESSMLMPGALLPIGRMYADELRRCINVIDNSSWYINAEGRLELGTGEFH
jgi:DNA-binding LytR/AlgR family response regulator